MPDIETYRRKLNSITADITDRPIGKLKKTKLGLAFNFILVYLIIPPSYKRGSVAQLVRADDS